MPKIKNINYRNFIDNGSISLLSMRDIESALENVKGKYGKHIKEARCVVITLYYTGARPVEIMELRGKHISLENSYVKIQIPFGAKRGYPRPILISKRFRMARELYDYSKSIFPEQYMFYHYRTNYVRQQINKKGEIKEYIDTSKGIYYHVKKWFKNIVPGSITPYFLRHNKISQLAEAGATDAELQTFKGARDPKSIQAYKHMSRKMSHNLARMNK